MDNWKEFTLEELKGTDKRSFAMGPFGSRIKAENFVSEGIPVIKGGNLNGDFLLEDSFDFLTIEKADELIASNAFPFDIVITHRGTIGQVGIIPEWSKYSRYVVSQSQLKLSFNTEIVNPLYIYYFLRSPEGQAKLLMNRSQVGVPAIAQALTSVRKITIKLPPPNEQNQIVNQLLTLDKKLKLNQQMNATLEEMARAVFKAWFVDFEPVHANTKNRPSMSASPEIAKLFPSEFQESELGLIPKGWEVIKLNEVSERVTKGTTPKTFVDNGINFVKAESLTNERGFIIKKFSFIDNDTNESLQRSQLREDDILFSIAGTIGRLARVIKQILPANTNQALAIIRPNQTLIEPFFIELLLSRTETQHSLTSQTVHAVQANLSLTNLGNLKFSLPDILIQRKLFEILNTNDVIIKNNIQQNITLEEIRDSLLPRLISGKIRVGEIENEVANAI